MKKRVWGVAVFGLLLGALGYDLVVNGGALKDVPRRAPGPCRTLGEVPGPEDLALDRGRGVLYVSSHDRRHPQTPGAIYAVDLGKPFAALAVRRLPSDYPERFYPHGISLLVRPDGGRRLYAISHPGLATARSPLDFGTEHRIDVFAAEPDGLRFQSSLRGEALQNPNDLFARAEDDIYVSRDHGGTSALGKFAEDLLRLPRSSLLHFDGRGFRTVAEGLRYGNGVTGAGDRLYVSEVLGRKVREYAVEGPGKLRELRALPLPLGPDNLELDEAGALWTAGHPAPLQFLLHAMRPGRHAPSQGLRITLGDGRVEEVYSDPGTELSGSSVALRAGKVLFLGAVFERHIVACAME